MSSFALIRRWISGVFRSRAALAADRNIIGSGESPWLMIQPSFTFSGPAFKFWCCATDEIYSFLGNHHKSGGEESLKFVDAASCWNIDLVGSSHGWLALHDNLNHHLYLFDPTTHRDIEFPLPPPMLGDQVHSAILSSNESDGKMFVIFGSGHSLACCSLRRGSHEWTLFGDEAAAYESIVYSSTHRLLFGITSTLKLEAWDVGGDSPRLDSDWVTEFDPISVPDEGKAVLLKYLVCEEESGELYVVVRHVKHGGDWKTTPTVDFEVYKIDREGGRLVKMVDSLGGLAMFVGNNHPIAIKIKDDKISGVKPNSIYFAQDTRHITYSARDNGIFNYQNGLIINPPSPASSYSLGDPIWFTPAHHNNT
ncbi:hypothetical protein OROGR_008299 [Orobanche gracilis]